MLQACDDDDRTKRPKHKFIDSKIKELRPLLKLLAKYSTNPPGSLREPDEGTKYRMPRWHHTLKALFQDHESEKQDNIISLIDSCFIDEDQSSHVSSTDHGSETPLSNNEEDEEDSFGEGASASALEAYKFPALSEKRTMEKKRSPVQKQGLSSEFTKAKGRVSKELSSQRSIRGQKRKASQVSRIEPLYRLSTKHGADWHGLARNPC